MVRCTCNKLDLLYIFNLIVVVFGYLQFYCCGVGGKTKERIESLGDYKGWDVSYIIYTIIFDS